ncbi:hypothetical protein T492DRAFT_844579 [Pavlovales sp. CCMP2436]|nr:hypothetical protein T492DRAFT_844579 [Pavlovales sp. CCMP2436]
MNGLQRVAHLTAEKKLGVGLTGLGRSGPHPAATMQALVWQVTLKSYDLTGQVADGSRPAEWTLSGSNDNSSFSNVQSFAGLDWTFSGEVKTFAIAVAHPKYSIWRLTVTKLQPGSTDYVMIVDMKLYTGSSLGRINLMSAISISDHSFKIIMGDTSGAPVSMLNTPVDWTYNIILMRSVRVVNTGLYKFALPGIVTKLN